MKTTKAHFSEFCREVNVWSSRLGLHRWEILIKHCNVKGAQACCVAQWESACAEIFLSHDVSPGGIEPFLYMRRLAKHEVLELFIMEYTLAMDNKADWKSMNQIRHHMINVLMRELKEEANDGRVKAKGTGGAV